jgi:hypothetical protein
MLSLDIFSPMVQMQGAFNPSVSSTAMFQEWVLSSIADKQLSFIEELGRGGSWGSIHIISTASGSWV